MRIVFWSGEESSGTTSNLIAAAGMLAARQDKKVAVIPAGKDGKDLAGNFSGKPAAYVGEDCEYYALDGLDYLLNAAKYGELSGQQVREAMRTFADGKLLCLPYGARRLRGYYPKETQKILERVIVLSGQMADISLIDCGCGTDEWTLSQLRCADLIVVNLKQSPQAFDRFFTGEQKMPEKLVFCVGSYQKDSVYNLRNLQRIYRIEPARLCAVPYNPEFEQACREGKSDKYMKGKRGLPGTQQRQYFLGEVERTVRILTGCLEDARGEEKDKAGAGGAGKRACRTDFKKKSL